MMQLCTKPEIIIETWHQNESFTRVTCLIKQKPGTRMNLCQGYMFNQTETWHQNESFTRVTCLIKQKPGTRMNHLPGLHV